jgi:hypothetical protein
VEADKHWHERARDLATGILSRTVDFVRGCEELAALWDQTRANELHMFRSWCDPTLAVKRWRTDEVGAKRLARTLLQLLDDGWEAVTVDLTPALREARDLLAHHGPGSLEDVYHDITRAHPEWLAEADWGGDDWSHFFVEEKPPPPTPWAWEDNPRGWRIANAEEIGAIHIRVPLALCDADHGDGLVGEARKHRLAVFRYQLPDMPIYTVNRPLASALFPRYASSVSEVGEEERLFLSDFMYYTL